LIHTFGELNNQIFIEFSKVSTAVGHDSAAAHLRLAIIEVFTPLNKSG